MAYEIAYFTRFTLPKTSLADVQAEYVNWALGHGPYFKSQDNRRAEGVDRLWKFNHVVAAKRLRGQNDYELESRQRDGLWVLRMRFRDRSNPAVFFEHQVRLQTDKRAVTVEHGVRRSAPALPPLTFPPRPRVVASLVQKHPDVAPINLDRGVVSLPEADVDGFVHHQLLDSKSIGWVMVSPRAVEDRPLVNDAALSKWLQGIAVVAVLETDAAARAFNAALAKRNLREGFRCFDGAIRAYDLSRGTDRLPVIFPEQLAVLEPPQRTPFAGAELTRRLSVRAMPPAFFTLIEEEDRAERARLIAEISARAKNDEGSKNSLAELQALFEESERENRSLEQQSADLSAARAQAELDRDLALEELAAERGKAAVEARRLNDEIERLRVTSKVVRVPVHVLDAIGALMAGEQTPARAVEITEALYGDRLTFLDTAKESARKAAGFQYPAEVGSLLVRLATDYFDGLQKSGGDAQARKVFGSKYAAKEANLSNQGKALRTFTVNGKQVFMESHLKAGTNKFSDAECLRIHFWWDPEQRRIVIGHCGEHLDL